MKFSYLQLSTLVIAGAHVAMLAVAPYSAHYLKLKKLALASGLIAVGLASWCFAGVIKWRVQSAAIPIAFCLAQVSSLVALSSANFSFRLGWRQFEQFYRHLPWRRPPLFAGAVILLAAIYEEMIWRQLLMTALGGGFIANIVVTLLFCACHISERRKIRYPRMIDLGFFSLVAGLSFQVTGNLAFVSLIHWLKNSMIFLIRCRQDPQYSGAMRSVRDRIARRPEFQWIARKTATASGPFREET
jgi:membrane protease YdiL (CAAX protease family)